MSMVRSKWLRPSARTWLRAAAIFGFLGAVSIVMLMAGGESGAQSDLGTAAARGRYLVRIMDCAGCHTDGGPMGMPDPSRYLAGSEVGFGVPGAGVVYPGNLTPDAETGLGRWSDAEIIRALRHGRGRDGRALAPVMPWPSYSALTEADAEAIVAYLRSLEPVRHAVPASTADGQRGGRAYVGVVAP
jgi:mono/diheme cytochrome c family protein